MYNAEIKERFVKSCSSKISVRTAYKQFFDIAQKYEEQWGTDLYTRAPEEVSRFLSEASGLTSQSQVSAIRIIKAYIKWCLSQEDIFGVQEDLLTITSISSDKFKEQTVTSPIHLQRYLDTVFDPEDFETIDNVYRTYFWMAYAGINQDDAPKIKNGDVDFSEMVVRQNGRSYPIYREGIKAIRYCVELDYLKSLRTNTGKLILFSRADSDLIMRGRSSVFTGKALRERISKKQKNALNNGKTNLRLSYFRVWISGLFYRVYLDEISGIEPDFLFLIKDIDSAKGTKNRLCDLKKHAKYYYEDYLRWKDSLNK